MGLNIAIAMLIIVSISLLVLLYIAKSKKVIVKDDTVEYNTIEQLTDGIKDTFNSILKANLLEMNLTKDEMEKKKRSKGELRNALKNCAFGDSVAKTYIKGYIKDLLCNKYGVNEDSINDLIRFKNFRELTSQDKFEIILYTYKKKYGKDGLERMLYENNLAQSKANNEGEKYYEINAEDIHRVYSELNIRLSFDDKLNIVSQRVYQLYKGFGVIDEIRDMRVDGVSGGVSGIPQGMYDLVESDELMNIKSSYDGVWMFFKGNQYHLSCLTFGGQKELERVCRNIYRYNSPGQLSESKGYIVNEMKDGSRVVVVRPPMAESWMFWVRKFDSVIKPDIQKLVSDNNAELPITFIKWLIKSCRTTAITGQQGSGKTTFMMATVGFIDPSFPLRIQEMAFELHLRKLYPNRNIATFKETADISGQEGLNLQKKTDGAVNILGEVAEAGVASYMVQMGQVGSKFTLYTHHGKTTKSMVKAIRNNLLETGVFTNEKIAEQQVAEVVNFDIHWEIRNGHRYIERITEIIPLDDNQPYSNDYKQVLDSTNNINETLCAFLDNVNDYFYRQTDRTVFNTVDIIRFEDGEYRFVNPVSERALKDMKRVLTTEQIEKMKSDFAKVGVIGLD